MIYLAVEKHEILPSLALITSFSISGLLYGYYKYHPIKNRSFTWELSGLIALLTIIGNIIWLVTINVFKEQLGTFMWLLPFQNLAYLLVPPAIKIGYQLFIKKGYSLGLWRKFYQIFVIVIIMSIIRVLLFPPPEPYSQIGVLIQIIVIGIAVITAPLDITRKDSDLTRDFFSNRDGDLKLKQF